MFTLEITLGNAAMADAFHVAAALRQVAESLEQAERSGRIYDDNGNSVGSFRLAGEDEG